MSDVNSQPTPSRGPWNDIVWPLALRSFDPPLVESDRACVHWPIYNTTTTEWFISITNGFANHRIPTGAIDQIKAAHHQNAGYESLWWLNEIVNEDTHRMPLLTIGHIEEVTVTLAVPAIFFDLTKEPSTVTIPGHLATESQTPMQSDVQMKGQATIHVTWKDVPVPSEPVERTLEEIVKCVANLIPRFDEFFP